MSKEELEALQCPVPGARAEQLRRARSTSPGGSGARPAPGAAPAPPSAPNTAPTHSPKTPSRHSPPCTSVTPTKAAGPRDELRRAGEAAFGSEGWGYLHMPPTTPAILQSHLYHQVMPSSAEAAAGSGAAAAAAAGNCSSCELISPRPPGAQRPGRPPQPQGATPCSRGDTPTARPGPVPVSPCRAGPPQG